jgi:glycosyltransferase involved in cell wall biosynthesis
MGAHSRNILVAIYSGFMGGAERSMLDCAAAVHARAEFFIHVACPPESGVEAAARARGLVTHPTEFPQLEIGRSLPRASVAPVAAARCIVSLRRLIRAQNIALVHGNGIKAALPAAVAARSLGVPFVYHVRDFPRRRAANLAALAIANAAIAPARFVKNSLPGGRSRCVVVANGVDAPERTPVRGSFRVAHGIPVRAPLIAMVAQLAPWKRHDLFVDAALVLRGRPDAMFCIAGGDITGRNSAYANSLRRRAMDAQLSGRLLFLGHLDNVAPLFADSDVLVLPSDNEPFGRVVVEAWHCGAPVVVAGGSGPAELVEDNITGLVAEKGSAKSFAEAIGLLLTDASLRDRLARAGGQQALCYSVAAHAQSVASVYRGLIKT